MNVIEFYSNKNIESITRKRDNEIKLGEEVRVIHEPKNWENELKSMDTKFVLLGIPEDIGIRANMGRGGAHTAWKPTLDSFLNQQSNEFLNGNECCVLGHVFVEDLMERSSHFNLKTETEIFDYFNECSGLIIKNSSKQFISKTDSFKRVFTNVLIYPFVAYLFFIFLISVWLSSIN